MTRSLLPADGVRADGRDAVKNSADAQQVKRAKKEARRLATQEGQDFAAVLSTPEGRRVFSVLLGWAKTFQTTFDTATADPYRAAFYAGQRDIGLRILDAYTTHHPNAFLQLLSERLEANTMADAEDALAPDPTDITEDV